MTQMLAKRSIAHIDQARLPGIADRARFWAFFFMSMIMGWTACLLWMLSSYVVVQDWIQQHLHWVLGWVGTVVPARQIAPERPESLDWFIWGLGPAFIQDSQPPSGIWDVVSHAAELAWQPLWLPDPRYRTGNVSNAHSVWWMLGLWHFGLIFAVRGIWDRWGRMRRTDACPGHLICVGRFEWGAGIAAGVLAMWLLALWRIERGLWEASILNGSAGRWTSIEMNSGASWVLVMQITIIHWLLVWWAYRWTLRRGLRKGTVVPLPTGPCPNCGYESPTTLCPECGADRNDPKSIRPRIVVPWIEKRAWMRWVFRTRTALVAIVVLFFAPAWVPLVRMGISAIWP